MSVNINEDTEFNDALRKYGIIPERSSTPRSPSPPPSPSLSDLLDDVTSQELRERAEESRNDETERAIEALRRKRLAEERADAKRARFGRVYPIGRDDYTREVTEESKIDEDDDGLQRGTGVVCFLYKDGIARSDVAKAHVEILACRYPNTKFVSIVGDKCIPDLPDARIPMFIIYRKGNVINQLVSWGSDRERRIEELEALLIMAGAIIPSFRRPTTDQDRNHDTNLDSTSDESEDEGNRLDPSSRMRSAATFSNTKNAKNVRGSAKGKGNDSDSDFEFDL